MSGLKTAMENGMFWSEIGSGFGEQGGTPFLRIPRSTLRGVGGGGVVRFSALVVACFSFSG